MKIIEKINKLNVAMNRKESENIGEIIMQLTKYVTFTANKEIKNEKSDRVKEQVENKYKQCLDSIKTLNSLYMKNFNEKIFVGSIENRGEVEEFLLELLNEIFESRKINRK